jgi:uncharacterized protein YjiS (DUF1127 family)
MYTSAEFDRLPSTEHAVADAAVSHRIRATTVQPGRPADNDSCVHPAASYDEIDSWARHAFAANGFGDAVISRPSSFELAAAARAQRSRAMGEMLARLVASAWAMVRRAYAWHRQYRMASATFHALRELDDHTLRDLGMHRSEISSVAAELGGLVERTRIHTGAREAM